MTELDVSGDRLVVKRGRGRRVPRGCLESGFMVILYEDGLSGSPTPRSGEGSEKAERTRVPLTTKHRGILSYVLDGVR